MHISESTSNDSIYGDLAYPTSQHLGGHHVAMHHLTAANHGPPPPYSQVVAMPYAHHSVIPTVSLAHAAPASAGAAGTSFMHSYRRVLTCEMFVKLISWPVLSESYLKASTVVTLLVLLREPIVIIYSSVFLKPTVEFTPCLKTNVPPLTSYNFDTCEQILIFLAEMLPIK